MEASRILQEDAPSFLFRLIHMIYIENNNYDPTYNLAFEEYVFTGTQFEEPVLLLWQNEPSVIIGRYQNTIEEINYDFIKQQGIRVVRRNTGGGAVYHDLGNLNYSFIIPGMDSTKIDFKTFTGPVIKALRSVGVEAEQSGRNDILADGRKFSGNAQHISRGRLLHHGTLMFDVKMDDVSSALNVKPGKFRSKATKSVRSRVTNLKPLIDTSLGIGTTADLKSLLLEYFRREEGIKEVSLTPWQLEEIEELRREKYLTNEWNYGRSPSADIVRGDYFRCGQVVFHFTVDSHRITDLKITGDFFSGRDISQFEKTFVGVPYEKDEIFRVLIANDLASYLGDITAEELIEVIV